ncbi:MAG: ABC transporter ATP-binding protein [Altibacter sp.]|uniref:ABC transporter ATP-binding protein n=1 Tax=Altibacter sp. TaxID=2024823 RepID=UPI001D5DD963|nr:ABC transporter ATP-binding protein [Altibacter sp.]MBZ0328291.1 ABC transporter ATP-binding protein [Altibacter sp.]
MKIELKNISFGYNATETVLDNISFTVNPSSCTSIVGSSGSGKSTILRLINGMLQETNIDFLKGEIKINDSDIIKEKIKWKNKRSKGELGYMFQNSNLLPHLSVEKNIKLPLKILGKKTEENEIVSDYLKITGLINHKNKLPKELSGGMKTRAALARTFITNPKLLLLDEPFSSLDIVWKSELYEEVKRLKNLNNTTVILVTHDIFEAVYFSNNIVILGDNHKIIKSINIPNWSDELSYNDVVLKYNKEFVEIKKCIEENRGQINL